MAYHHFVCAPSRTEPGPLRKGDVELAGMECYTGPDWLGSGWLSRSYTKSLANVLQANRRLMSVIFASKRSGHYLFFGGYRVSISSTNPV